MQQVLNHPTTVIGFPLVNLYKIAIFIIAKGSLYVWSITTIIKAWSQSNLIWIPFYLW